MSRIEIKLYFIGYGIIFYICIPQVKNLIYHLVKIYYIE